MSRSLGCFLLFPKKGQSAQSNQGETQSDGECSRGSREKVHLLDAWLKRAGDSGFGCAQAGQFAFERRSPSSRGAVRLGRTRGRSQALVAGFSQKRRLRFSHAGGARGLFGFPRRRPGPALTCSTGFGLFGNATLARTISCKDKSRTHFKIRQANEKEAYPGALCGHQRFSRTPA